MITDESIVNAIFYWILGIIALGVMRVDVQALMTSLGAFFVGVGFIIGNACSKFLEVSDSAFCVVYFDQFSPLMVIKGVVDDFRSPTIRGR